MCFANDVSCTLNTKCQSSFCKNDSPKNMQLGYVILVSLANLEVEMPNRTDAPLSLG